jgi:hypothetical protein
MTVTEGSFLNKKIVVSQLPIVVVRKGGFQNPRSGYALVFVEKENIAKRGTQYPLLVRDHLPGIRTRHGAAIRKVKVRCFLLRLSRKQAVIL